MSYLEVIYLMMHLKRSGKDEVGQGSLILASFFSIVHLSRLSKSEVHLWYLEVRVLGYADGSFFDPYSETSGEVCCFSILFVQRVKISVNVNVLQCS